MKKVAWAVVTMMVAAIAFSVIAMADYQYPKQTQGFVFLSQAKKTPPYTIGLSNFSLGNSWRVQMIAEVQWEAERLGPGLVKELIVTNAEGSISKQISDIEDLISRGCDAILITASSPTALVPVVEEAMREGVVVVDYDNLVYTDNTTAKIIVNQEDFGRVQAEFLVEALGGKGNIVVFNGIKGTAISAERWAGAKAVFDQYPDIKILQTVYADWDYAKAKAAAEDLLAAYPKIDGVWSQGGAMTQACMEAFIENGRPLVPMSGEDSNGFLKLWAQYADKGFKAIATSMPTYCSSVALDVALAALQGMPYYKYTVIPIPTITPDTISQYVQPDLPDSFWCNSRLPKDIAAKLFKR